MNQPFSKCQKEYEERLLTCPPIPVDIREQALPSISEHPIWPGESEDDTPGTPTELVEGVQNDHDHAAQTLDGDSDPAASNNPGTPSIQDHYQPSDGGGSFIVNEHPTAGKVYGRGNTFMDIFHADQYSDICKDNPYYPFASNTDWEIADFLLRLPLSMAQIDEFIKLKLVRCPVLLLVTAILRTISYRFKEYHYRLTVQNL